jgi:hypothetical protein
VSEPSLQRSLEESVRVELEKKTTTD